MGTRPPEGHRQFTPTRDLLDPCGSRALSCPLVPSREHVQCHRTLIRGYCPLFWHRPWRPFPTRPVSREIPRDRDGHVGCHVLYFSLHDTCQDRHPVFNCPLTILPDLCFPPSNVTQGRECSHEKLIIFGYSVIFSAICTSRVQLLIYRPI